MTLLCGQSSNLHRKFTGFYLFYFTDGRYSRCMHSNRRRKSDLLGAGGGSSDSTAGYGLVLSRKYKYKYKYKYKSVAKFLRSVIPTSSLLWLNDSEIAAVFCDNSRLSVIRLWIRQSCYVGPSFSLPPLLRPSPPLTRTGPEQCRKLGQRVYGHFTYKSVYKKLDRCFCLNGYPVTIACMIIFDFPPINFPWQMYVSRCRNCQEGRQWCFDVRFCGNGFVKGIGLAISLQT